MRISLIIWLLGLAALGWANDGPMMGHGGRVFRMPGKQTTIRMVREWVKMDLFPHDYQVKVQFIFQNDGPATTVTMGFPECGSAGEITDPAFMRFHTWVDGREVKAVRKLNSGEVDLQHYAAFWVKTVSFARNQQRTVRVEYTTTGLYNSDKDGEAYYDFTGGNWKDEVEESDLCVTFHIPGTFEVDPSEEMTEHGNALFHRWMHWQADKEFKFDYHLIRADAMMLRNSAKQPFDAEQRFPCIVALPGKCGDPINNPPIINKQGVVYVALRDLADCINKTRHNIVLCEPVDWDAHTRSATLTCQHHILHFTLHNPIMRVDGSPDVTLPAAPFFSIPLKNDPQQPRFLYAPLRPIVQALGGKISIDIQHRVVILTFHGEDQQDTDLTSSAERMSREPRSDAPAQIDRPGNRFMESRKKNRLHALVLDMILVLVFLLVLVFAFVLIHGKRTSSELT